MNKAMHKSLLIVVPALAGLLIIPSVFADDTDVVDVVTITVPVSCTMSGTGMNSHNKEIANGTYESEIGTTTLHAFCNDNSGFAIYATGYTGDEIGGTNSNKLVGTSASSNATIVTGLATSTPTPDVSNWAMKLAIAQDSGDITGTNAFTIDSDTEGPFSIYHTVPNEYTKVAHKNSNTDMTASTGGVKLTTTYAAYISKTQPADTYTGQVIYTLVHPASANAPLVCKPNGTTISTIVCMQDINSNNKSTILASMTEGQQYTLVDNRDEKTYFIAKQADGNIWMTQNLDLCIGCTGVAPLTSENTDLNVSGTGIYAEGYSESNDVITWTPASTAITSNSVISGNSVEGWRYSERYPYSVESGDVYVYTSGTNNNDIVYYSESDCTAIHNDGTCPHYHVGNYYNKTAVSASNDSNYSIGDSSPAENSICPAGWRLPLLRKYDSTSHSYIAYNEYGNLLYVSGVTETTGLEWDGATYTTNGFNDIRVSPLFLTRAGIILSGSSLEGKGYKGDYQSSSRNNLSFNNSKTSPNNSYFSDDGDAGLTISVRCLVR